MITASIAIVNLRLSLLTYIAEIIPTVVALEDLLDNTGVFCNVIDRAN